MREFKLSKKDQKIFDKIHIDYCEKYGKNLDDTEARKTAFTVFLRHKALTDLFFFGYEIFVG